MSFESINPATGELLATYPEHDAHEVEARLQLAWDCWQRWSQKAGVRASGLSDPPRRVA
jgi:succinate-semialdehyde dehydrogenase/glutarate-semialdehyde dehydrogenase/succinate-semialdehyde dehydrogenase